MEIAKYAIKKLVGLVISLFVISTITFILMKSIPGDPFAQEQAIPEEIMKSLHAYYGLDKPLHVQYVKYMKGIVTWNLGPSFKYEGRTINEIIKNGFPISASLGLSALFLSLAMGLTWGSISAYYRSKWQDNMALVASVLGMSIPNFVFASLLQYVFAMKLAIAPVARWGTISHMILPTLALAAFPTAFIARLARSSMVEVLEQDYVLTAKAKGLSPKAIIVKHVLKNSLLPIISYIGTLGASIISGSFVIEKIFGIPGLGNWFVLSIANRDYTIIMGITVFYSFLMMFFVFLADIFYNYLDPRIRHDLRGGLNGAY